MRKGATLLAALALASGCAGHPGTVEGEPFELGDNVADFERPTITCERDEIANSAALPERSAKLTATLKLDDEYSADQVEAILACMSAWNVATDGLVDLDAQIEAVDAYAQPLSLAVVDEIPGSPNATGQTQWPGLDRIITVRWLERGQKLFARTVCHELGHYLGLRHVDDPSALMYAHATSDEITPADVAQFWELHGIAR